MTAAIASRIRPATSEHRAPASGELALLDIAGDAFALPIAAIVAVLDPQQMDRVQRGDDGLWIGELGTRSGLIPVADSRQVFGLPSVAPIGRVLVLRSDPLVALAVDGLLGSLLPGGGDIQPLPVLCGSPAQLLVDAMVWNGDEPLLRIAPAALDCWLRNSDGRADPEASATVSVSGDRDAWHDGRALLVDVVGELCALPVSYVRQISAGRSSVRLPRARPTIAGLVSWERAPIPVIDATDAFDRVGTSEGDRMLVVIGTPKGSRAYEVQPLAALCVTDVLGVATAEEWHDDAILLADGRRARSLDLAAILGAR